jgi:SHAQKYF class myb-like DNA-binding protein
MTNKMELLRSGRWSEEEHKIYMKAKKLYGPNWHMIALMVGTRSRVQVKSHDQKYKINLQRPTTYSVTRRDASVQVNLSEFIGDDLVAQPTLPTVEECDDYTTYIRLDQY